MQNQYQLKCFYTILAIGLVGIFYNFIEAEERSNHTQEDAYKKMYQAFFGKAPPEKESVEIPVNLFIDLQQEANIIILSDTFSKWIKLSKSDFLNFIIPRLKSDSKKKLTAQIKKFDQWIDTDWLTKKGFKLDYITTDQYLEIRIPPEIKGVQRLDLSKRPSDIIEIEHTKITPTFFSAYSNIDYKRTYTNYEEAQEETITNNNTEEFTNDITLKNHLSLGNLLIENETNFHSNTLSFDSLYLSKVINDSILKAGFLDIHPLAGIQIENIEISRFLKKSKKFKSFKFSTSEKSYLTVKINRKTVYKQTLFPGTYKLTNLPVKNGDNDISINVIDSNRNIIFKKEFYTYISNYNLSQFNTDYDIKYALYDQGESLFENRIQNFPFTMLDYSFGLGSFMNKYAMTLHSKWYQQDYQNWKQVLLSTGTKIGLINTSVAISNIDNSQTGFFASFSFDPSDKLLKKLNQKKILFTGSIQNSTYSDFIINPVVSLPTNGGFISLNTSFSLFPERPFSLTIDKYFSGEYTGKLITGYVKKNRFLEKSINLALSFSDTEVTPFFFINIIANFQKSNSTGTLTYKPGSEPEASYNLPYAINDTPVNITISPERQAINLAKEEDDQVISLDFNTNNELTAKMSGSNSRAAYGYTFRKNFTSNASNSFTSNSMYLTTAVMISGKHAAISRPINDNTFLVISSHEKLKQSDVKVDEELTIDYLGPAGVHYLKPSSKNNISLKPENIPHDVIIEKDSIEFTPQYGRGYHITVGKDAPIILIGRMVDDKGNAEDLVYGKLIWDTGEKTFFTNQRGMFQTTLEEPGKNYIIELVDYPGMKYEFTIDKEASGVINLKSVSVKSVTKQSNSDEKNINKK